MEKIFAIIQRIQMHNPDVANALGTLADNFEFVQVLNIDLSDTKREQERQILI